jgi:hypothetical protein
MFIQIHQWQPDIIHRHPYALLIAYYIFSNATSSLPAPTAKSSVFYQWFFKFANGVGANLSRAFSTAVEGSPNWQSAVDKHMGNGATDNQAAQPAKPSGS